MNLTCKYGEKAEKPSKIALFQYCWKTALTIPYLFCMILDINEGNIWCIGHFFGKILVLEIFWKRLSANQIAPFFKSQYLMNLLSRYVHILHGGRPDWEEVIDIFHDVTCLPKHARACPHGTKIALSPILLLNNVYFLILNLISNTTHPIWLIFD